MDDHPASLSAFRNGTIDIISEKELNGREVLDASGLIVAPGFIDLYAHGQDPVSNQAADGVTTAMDLEAGVYPVAKWYASREGRSHQAPRRGGPAHKLLTDSNEVI